MADVEKLAGTRPAHTNGSDHTLDHNLTGTTAGNNSHFAHRALTPGGHPVDTSQPAFPVYHRRFANPAPLGLLAFATTTFVLSWFNAGIRDIRHPNVVVGLALGFGGLAQLLAGMWEFATGNTFGATAFSAYGAFWLSYATIQWPGSGILSANWAPGELESALGIYLMAWFIFTFLMWLGTFKSSVGLCGTFTLLWITFLLLACGDLQMSSTLKRAGGGMGLATAFVAFYTGIAGILTPETSYFVLPVGDLSGKSKRKVN